MAHRGIAQTIAGTFGMQTGWAGTARDAIGFDPNPAAETNARGGSAHGDEVRPVGRAIIAAPKRRGNAQSKPERARAAENKGETGHENHWVSHPRY